MKTANCEIFRFANAILYRLETAVALLSTAIFLLAPLFGQSLYAQDNYGDWSYSCNIIRNVPSSGANISGRVSSFTVLMHLNPDTIITFSKTGSASFLYALEMI